MLLNSKIVNKGWEMKPFNLLSVSGNYINSHDVKKKNGLLIAFICNHCPYVKDIVNRMVSDFNELKKLDVGIVAIMSNDTDNYPEDSYENMIKFSNSNKFTFHYLYDEKQDVAKNYNAVCTPDFYCFDKNNQLFYRGRLDNLRYQSKNQNLRKKELVHSFKLKINDNVTQALQHSSMGCSIKWKRKN